MRDRDLGERFEEIYKQGGAMGINGSRIIVDRETGVQYLISWIGSSGGITPLLDKDGKPLIDLKY